jgi:hypothetical protein
MKVGSLVFATDQGLGFLAKAFCDHGVVTDVLVIRHGRHPEHDEWYPSSPRIGNLRSQSDIRAMEKFCTSMDIMLFFETPFRWELIDHCRRIGVKTVLMPMYECEPAVLPVQPDLFLNPSHLDQKYYPSGIHLPVPVEYPWCLRERAEVFIHNAGHGGLKGRNGTKEIFEAVQYIRTTPKIRIRSQSPLDMQPWAKSFLPLVNRGGHIQWEFRTLDARVLYDGDVFLFPEKFNGLSLPLQEARAAGMLVMCGDRFPMNEWLPKNPLIPVASSRWQRVGPPYNEFDEAVFDPKAIAAKIDEWHGRDISEYSRSGREWAESMSWERLKPRYLDVLRGLLS